MSRPDWKLTPAKKFMDELCAKPENELLKYYVDHMREMIRKQDEKIEEYQQVFDLIKRFTG